MRPELPIMPAEIIEAARNVNLMAQKWSMVADAFLSWHLPVAFVLGALIGAGICSLWSRNK